MSSTASMPVERADLLVPEPGRGVYEARRAAALSGVPKSTLHYWARTGLYEPSIARGPRVRLWSWADLLALRALDWFRRSKGEDGPPRASIARIRRALAELDREGLSRERLSGILAVSDAGELFLRVGEADVRALPERQAGWGDALHLVRPYQHAPDLLEPRPLLQIIPGKLHGEPHLVGTRIPSATVYALHEDGYTVEEIQAMYPEASRDGLEAAIELEQSLLHGSAA
jgi:uncharacterized protein (DUF433 family)/DNA-binding transcriptional MerR regulator